ncbi:MAG: enoyl-CoA hydratase-related protein [Cyclobacteriaceae bacterium]|nr:enoyl-CoA hydratase-related protein [Cyclobacteriaceae bacterium]
MKYINTHKEGRLNYITLNRPDKKNALNFEMVSEIKEALREAASDEEVKIIILRGAGDTFCAGADLAYLKKLQLNTYEENLADSEHLKGLFYQIYTMEKVVIAQVDGYAIAGGAGLATVCDFTFATPEAVFGYSEVKIGFVPAIVMVFLLRKISELHARELLIGGNRISAQRALEIGMINKIIAKSDLESTVKEFANKLCEENSGQSMTLTKQMIASIQTKDLVSALDYAAEKNARARSFLDCKEGISSFLEKKKIKW